MENKQPLSIEQAQAKIIELENKLAVKNKQPLPIEFRIQLESGEVQVRRLTPNTISFPAEVWKQLLKQSPKLIDFLFTNNHLLPAEGDTEEQLKAKEVLRRQVFTENPKHSIVRPRRQTA
jgi:hypothetical protein